MKKYNILSLLIIISLILGCTAPAYAAGDDASIPAYEINLLEGIGISINTSASSVTRGEFATHLARTAGSLAPALPASEMLFSDVSLTQTDSASITAVCTAGLMNGVGDGKFMPNASISSIDAAVSLVRLAGYERAALVYGGYPTGYLRIASNTGILDGVTVDSNPLTPSVLSALLYNTLHTDVYQLVSVGDITTYEARSGEDVLMIYHNIYQTEALVTANRFTSLVSSVTQCGKDEIELNKQLYKYISQDMEKLIGMNVVAYYRKSSADSKGTVISMHADETVNKTLTLTDKDIAAIDGYTISYYVGDRIKTASINRGFNLILNGKYYSAATMADLAVDDCELTLIDSDSSGSYETVVLSHGVTMIVTNIDRTAYKIYGKNNISVIFDSSEMSSYFEITDKAGNDIYIDRIKNGNVLTVFASKDSQCIKIVLSTDTVSGTITSVDSLSGMVTLLSGKEELTYEIASGYESDIVLGLDGDFYLDAFGKLVYSDSPIGSDYEYGYLINVAFTNALNPPRLLILTAIDFEEFDVADKFTLDGITATLTSSSTNAILSAGKAIPQVVRYKTDSKDAVRYLDTVTVGSGDNISDTLELSKTVTGTYNEKFPNLSNACVFASDTLFIKAPTNAELLYDKDYYSVTQDMLRDNRSYTVKAYDMDETLTPKVAVYNSDTISVGGKLDNYSETGIVIEQYRCLDKEGDARDAIRIFTKDGTEKTLYFHSDYTVDKTMAFGDIILYEADADSNLMMWVYDYDCSTGSTALGTSNSSDFLSSSYFTKYIGYPYSKKDNSFSFLNIDGNADLNESWDHLLAFPTSVMTFIEVDMATKEIALSGYEYVDSYMHSKNRANKAFIKVYRGGGQYMDILVTYKNSPIS